MPRRFTPLVTRFWSRVRKGGPNDCWIWTGYENGKGYGMIGAGGRGAPMLLCHRVSYELVHGPTPLQVLHTCDTRRCVNPQHLFVGTHADNMRDMAVKQRCAWRKVPIADVPAIRVDPRPNLVIAAEYGVSDTAIKLIKQRKNHRHVP